MPVIPEEFRAYVARTDDGEFRRGIEALPTAILGEGGVLVRVERSSVNYKDSLAASANGRVARISPLIVGIDFAGEVLESDSPEFVAGDGVIGSGYDLGTSHHGGFAQLARVPAGWLVPMPVGLDVDGAMTIGTAGYTAALSVAALQARGLAPGDGPVLVTGATGGVGSIAVGILAGLGHEVVASSGKPEASGWLRDLGAAAVIDRAELTDTPKPLMPATYAAAVDAVGGATLAGVVARLRTGAAVAASGNTGGMRLDTTVAPFILRGVALLGIDTVTTPVARRRELWQRMTGDLAPRGLDGIRRIVSLTDVESALDEIARGGVRGRYVVDTTG
jgi:putative YhdH/YhfP family quinone oxidoreductase